MSADPSSTTRKQRVMDIERALRWAYQSELPKRREDRAITAPLPSAIHPMWRAGAFGGRIDNWTRDPGLPLALGDPHDDALRIEAAVDALVEDSLDIGPYAIGQGLGEHVDLQHVTSVVWRDVRAWIVTYARNGKRPDLGGPAEFEPVFGANGKAAIWQSVQMPCGEGPDGTPWFTTFDRTTGPVRAGLYPDGAFCKLRWVRSADDVAEDRARWAVWHAGLQALAENLAPLLQSISVVASDLPARPWIEAMPDEPTIRPNLLPRHAPPDTRRPVALRQPPNRRDPGRVVPRGEWPSRYRTAKPA